MNDNEVSPNYFNSVYNLKNNSNENNSRTDNNNNQNENEKAVHFSQTVNENLNDSKELKEINSRLGFYINAVKDLTQYLKFNNQSNMNTSGNNNSFWSSNMPNNNSLLVSMKNLEKDLESLKQLYDEEIKLMKFEIEELSIVKNKYSLENFNLELKLKDFVLKFEDIKKSNLELANELNEVKSKNNRLEFELENSKLECEKTLRENKQLKKDLEDLINKLNEKQAISDSEIAYRQDLETKFKELRESFTFEKKVNDQELENFKSQSKVFQETINDLEKKLSDALNRDLNFNDALSDLRHENNQLRSQNQQLEEQNDSLKNMCKNLETVIVNLEQMKKSLEDKVAAKDRSANNSSNISSEINSIKSKLEAEEIRLLQLMSKNQQSEPPSRFSFNTNQDDLNESNDIKNIENIGYLTQRSSLNKSRQSSVPFGQITNIQQKPISASNIYNQNQSLNKPYLPTVKSSDHLSSRITFNNLPPDIDYNGNPIHPRSAILDFQPSDFLNPPSYNLQSPLPFHQSTFTTPTVETPLNNNQNNNTQIVSQSSIPNQVYTNSRTKISDYKSKDITSDLFNTFERATFLSQNSPKREANNSSVSSVDNTTVTEASYVGNVKIHEVNKNGYYVRILNVSNTQEEDLSNYTIQQMVSTMPVAIYRLPQATKLLPGHTITIWSRTDEVEQQPPHTFVWYEQDKWGTGPECTTILAKPNGQAVSWTTGCHKYGNIDYDELVPVYSHKRNRTPVQLDRTKLIPQKIFAPTKHPHGSSSRLGTVLDSPSEQNLSRPNSTKNPTENTGFQRSFFSNQTSRPINSESSNKSRPQSSVSKNTDNNDTVYQENFTYFQKTQQQPPVLMNRFK